MSIESNLPDGPSEESKRIDRQLRDKFGAKSKEKPVPVPFRHIVSTDWYRRFSFKERIQILLGYGLEVCIRIPCRHNPGELQPLIIAETVPHDSATSMLKARAEEALQKEYGERMATVIHEREDKNPMV